MVLDQHAHAWRHLRVGNITKFDKHTITWFEVRIESSELLKHQFGVMELSLRGDLNLVDNRGNRLPKTRVVVRRTRSIPN
ncbi:MAG: hypothetical protein RIQ60_825 [Pseudomonadota bacterium]